MASSVVCRGYPNHAGLGLVTGDASHALLGMVRGHEEGLRVRDTYMGPLLLTLLSADWLG